MTKAEIRKRHGGIVVDVQSLWGMSIEDATDKHTKLTLLACIDELQVMAEYIASSTMSTRAAEILEERIEELQKLIV